MQSYPEYRAAQQYTHCVERLIASTPARVKLLISKPLRQGSELITLGVAAVHAVGSSTRDRHEYRDATLGAVAASREGLLLLREERVGSQPDLLTALELLERVEEGLERRCAQ